MKRSSNKKEEKNYSHAKSSLLPPLDPPDRINEKQPQVICPNC
jgi:hypothetical protein